ncbi:ATP-binding protein [Actinomycetospora lutea]|uniref:sensor histidine kinase n=1 Tax=Actinomycetospora lutea TaxID=663604 RepID=UPI00236675B6|nr:ATP-binding protein [Actinomycetospora lutea]MDD7939475.1 ATP-binding protein [Actinomycetospora lutea]
MPAEGRELRRALLRHGVVTVVVVLVAVVSITSGVALFARQDAHRTAENTARQVGRAVGVAVSRHDLSAPVDEDTRRELDAAVGPFLAGGMMSRVKIWSPRDGVARIVYSDEPRVEGETTRYDPAAMGPLGTGGSLVQEVPDDPEHRYEFAHSSTLLEVFSTFRDARGAETWLELYIRVDEAAAVRTTAVPVAAVAAAGLLLLAVATLPVSVSLARRSERARAEQRAARDYALAAAETARREIAQRLHDGVLPDLAGVGLLLEVVRDEGGLRSAASASVLGEAHALLTDEMRQLRGLLDDLVPPSVAPGGLAGALEGLAERLSSPTSGTIRVETSLDGPLPDDLELTLYRVAHELMRNAVRHAGASSIEVSVAVEPGGRVALRVTDDGDGFDAHAPPAAGHVGLLLVRGVLADRGGRLELVSGPGRGTSAVARVPLARPSAPRPRRGGGERARARA